MSGWRALIAVRLVSRDPAALARFYGAALGAATGAERGIAADEGLGRGRRLRLAIGTQAIELDAFDDPGAPYPDDIDAADLRFQHVAIVTADIAATHARAIAAGASAISRGGPVRLPASSGGVTAVKLRDPEGHPFELIAFPPGTGWDRVTANAAGVRGIDHSAIAVADAAASTRFYAAHGLTMDGATVNRGAEQAALDGIDAPVVDVVPLYPPARAPHLELLGYRRPARGGAVGLRDVAATRLVWAADRVALLADPDGHRHQLTPPAGDGG